MRSDAQREKGHGSGYAYYPERRPENPAASHAQVKEPRSKARGCRGVNRLGGPPDAPRAAGRKLCRFRKSDYLLPAVAKVFRVRDA